jgi:hypothetical protein
LGCCDFQQDIWSLELEGASSETGPLSFSGIQLVFFIKKCPLLVLYFEVVAEVLKLG